MLLHLQRDPLAPALKIARGLGISPTTATAAIDWLRENGVFTSVHADLNVAALGMEIVDVILYPTSYDALRALELRKAGHSNFSHPYVLYHTRIYGAKEGIYFQFQIPLGSRDRLFEFLKGLMDLNLISTFELLERDPRIQVSTRAKLENWNRELLRWEFDGDAWIDRFADCEPRFLDVGSVEPSYSELDYKDILLLSAISLDARHKNKELGEIVEKKIHESGNAGFKFKSQDLSRRLARLKTKYVTQFRLFVNWAYFDIYNQSLFFVKSSAETAARLADHLVANANLFPFESRLSGIREGFYWYIRAPSNAISFAAEFLWRKTTERQLCFLDYRSSEIYAFWADVFDSEQRAWKTDYYFMVEEPLGYFGPYIEKHSLRV